MTEPSRRQPRAGRARPLPPDERRAALIAAVLPLIAEHGPRVTTRLIAEAAGVAEGTIFRVFPDKDALLREAVAAALDPAPVLAELARIDLCLPLERRLNLAVAMLQRRFTRMFNLVLALGRHPPHDGPHRPDLHRHAAARREANERVSQALIRLLEPDRDRFNSPLPEVVKLLRLLTFSGSHPAITDGDTLRPEQIVSVVLNGVCRPTSTHP